MRNIKLSTSCIKRISIILVLFLAVSMNAQPLLHPYAFEDDYIGAPDSTMLLAKVKTHKTYYKSSYDKQKSLYMLEEFNKQGRLVSQKWYNFLSHKEMYSATYEYDKTGFFTLSKEKITSELDNFDFYSRKKNDVGYFVNGTPDNPMGEVIPNNDKGELVVNTIYTKDSLGGYMAKKYFYDNSFYKQKLCASWQYNQHLYNGLYIDTNKSLDFYYSKTYFKADTLISGDSLKISIKDKGDNKEYFKILKIKYNLTNAFEISELDVVNTIKVYFSPWRTGVCCITYIDVSNFQNRLLLEHRLIADFEPIKQKIWLKEMNNIKQLQGMSGALFYTAFKDGYLFQEDRYSLDNSITKMQEKHFGKNNLLLNIKSYAPHYAEIFVPFSQSFQTSYKENSIEEIHEYEYFEQ